MPINPCCCGTPCEKCGVAQTTHATVSGTSGLCAMDGVYAFTAFTTDYLANGVCYWTWGVFPFFVEVLFYAVDGFYLPKGQYRIVLPIAYNKTYELDNAPVRCNGAVLTTTSVLNPTGFCVGNPVVVIA